MKPIPSRLGRESRQVRFVAGVFRVDSKQLVCYTQVPKARTDCKTMETTAITGHEVLEGNRARAGASRASVESMRIQVALLRSQGVLK